MLQIAGALDPSSSRGARRRRRGVNFSRMASAQRSAGATPRKAGLVSGPGPAVPLDLRRPPAQAPFNCAGGPLSNAQNERREITPRKVGSLIPFAPTVPFRSVAGGRLDW